MRPGSSGGRRHVVITAFIGLIMIAFTGVTVLRTTSRTSRKACEFERAR